MAGEFHIILLVGFSSHYLLNSYKVVFNLIFLSDNVTSDDLISLPAKSKNKFLKVKVNTPRDQEEEEIVLKSFILERIFSVGSIQTLWCPPPLPLLRCVFLVNVHFKLHLGWKSCFWAQSSRRIVKACVLLMSVQTVFQIGQIWRTR
jgi:hypothetical protein